MARVAAAPVCIVTLTYTAPLDDIDRHMAAHVAWLTRGFDEGLFLLAGRQVPRTGGAILIRGHKPEVAALAASDPFVTAGVATAAVTELAVSFAADAVADLIG